MYYKYENTGLKEKWGYGLPENANIQILTNTEFALRPGGVISEVENPTITITALTEEEVKTFKENNSIADDWIPAEKETE